MFVFEHSGVFEGFDVVRVGGVVVVEQLGWQ